MASIGIVFDLRALGGQYADELFGHAWKIFLSSLSPQAIPNCRLLYGYTEDGLEPYQGWLCLVIRGETLNAAAVKAIFEGVSEGVAPIHMRFLFAPELEAMRGLSLAGVTDESGTFIEAKSKELRLQIRKCGWDFNMRKG